MSLTELHARLHRSDLAVAGRYPVKVLADALGYESDQGRVRRVQRGVYSATGETSQRWSRPRHRLWPGGPAVGELA